MAGLVLIQITGYKWVIVPSIIAAWLPDLIDKPLAVMVADLCSGRTYGHSLVLLAVATVIMAIIFRNYILLIISGAVSAGLHQIVDTMWRFPETWFYPLLGGFYIDPWIRETGGTFFSYYGAGGNTVNDWLPSLINAELADPIESASLVLVMVMGIGYFLISTGKHDEPVEVD